MTTTAQPVDTASKVRRRKVRVPSFHLDRAPRGVRLATTVLFVALLYYLPIWEPPFFTTEGIDFGGTLFTMATFCLVAVGLNVVVGQAGLLDLGYVGFFAVGAYTTAVLTSAHASLPWLATVPIAIAASVLAGIILGVPTLRLRGDYLAIVTLGFGEIIRLTAINSQWLGGSAGIKNVGRPPSSEWTIPGTDIKPFKYGVLDFRPYYWLTLTILIVVIILTRNLERSRVGRAWVAIREDEDAAELMGVPTFRFKLLAFAIGASIGGLAGTLFAARQGFINPQSFPLLLSILFLAAVVLGGAGNLPGVILGACVVSYLPERFREVSFLPGALDDLNEWRYFIFGSALVLMMIFRPEGLLPNRRRAAEVEARQLDAAGAGDVLDVDVEASFDVDA